MISVEDRLHDAAADVRDAAARTPLPSLSPGRGRGRTVARIALASVALGVTIGGLVVLTDDGSDESPLDRPTEAIDRFSVDGMHVESATQHGETDDSELFLNTPSEDPDSALPALIIITGESELADLSDWQVTGRMIEIFGQRVEARTLDGDPIGITWTTPAGVPVTIISEGIDLDEFEATIPRVRRLTADEWAEIAKVQRPVANGAGNTMLGPESTPDPTVWSTSPNARD